MRLARKLRIFPAGRFRMGIANDRRKKYDGLIGNCPLHAAEDDTVSEETEEIVRQANAIYDGQLKNASDGNGHPMGVY